EADLPTQQAGAQAPARLSQPHGDQGRPQGDRGATRARPQAAERLIAFSGAAVIERLKQRSEFLAASGGTKASASAFVLQARRRQDAGPARFGFTVAKKVGNAVERNRVRRRLKEMVRASAVAARRGHDYVVIGRRAALALPFAQLRAEFERAL